MTSSTFLTIWIAMFAVIVAMTIALAIIIKIKWGRTPAVTVITALVLTGGLVAVGRYLSKQNMANSCFFTILTILIAMFAVIVAMAFIIAIMIKIIKCSRMPAVTVITALVLTGGLVAVGRHLSKQNVANSCFFTILTILIAIIAINVGIFVFVAILGLREETPSTTTEEYPLVFLAVDTVFALMLVLVAGFIAVGILFLEQNITNLGWLIFVATFETILIVEEHWFINTPYWEFM